VESAVLCLNCFNICCLLDHWLADILMTIVHTSVLIIAITVITRTVKLPAFWFAVSLQNWWHCANSVAVGSVVLLYLYHYSCFYTCCCIVYKSNGGVRFTWTIWVWPNWLGRSASLSLFCFRCWKLLLMHEFALLLSRVNRLHGDADIAAIVQK